MTSKRALRATARAQRALLAAARPDLAATLAAQAPRLSIAENASVASYWPVRDEADPRALAEALAALGHPVLLPRVEGETVPLTFRRWRPGEPLATSPLGIEEPLPDAPSMIPQVVLVPLLAFDARGHRLGYGGGYYDRTLAALRADGPVLAIGIAYAGQELASLPPEPHDMRLDAVLTERGLRRFA